MLGQRSPSKARALKQDLIQVQFQDSTNTSIPKTYRLSSPPQPSTANTIEILLPPQNIMATHQELRHYLTHWFQLGKRIIINNTPHTIAPTLNTDRPSPEFETLWQEILANPHLAHLEDSEIDLAQLLTGTWEIIDCARCEMPVPLKIAGIIGNHCICQNMDTWPNSDTLQPHNPINTIDRLHQIRHRLTSSSQSPAS